MSSADALAAAAPAHIALVDGAAVLERDGQTDTTPLNMPLLAGDRVRTQSGRVEILFADGSTLHLDNGTTVDFQSDELVRLLDGRIRLSIPGPARSVSYRIDAPSASVEIAQPGEYRVAVLRGARDGEVELAVLRGAAELVNDAGRTPLRAGERAYSRANAAPSYAYVFNSASWDAFDRWSEARRDERLGLSAEYLPDQVRPYSAAFDRYGSWRSEPSYGRVWYPTVSVGWRPYYNGRWVTLRPYGWTWVGVDPWAWPTHHYGRWGISAGAWFWIPGRSWGPAWVSWAYAPDYVSWCPLGWNNRPIVQININAYGRGYDPWRAWTAVPRRHFGVDYVNTRHVAGHTFDARTRASFVPRNNPPETRGYAVPRASAPIRVAGTGGGRRVTSPVYTNLEPGASRVGAAPSRVIVGQPRSSVAEASGASPDRTRAVPRGAIEAGRAPGSPADSRSRRDAGVQSSSGADARYAPRAQDATRSDVRTRGDIRPPTGTAPRTEGYSTDRRAIPREDRVYRVAPSPSPRTYDSTVERAAPSAGRPAPRSADDPIYRTEPYGRRAPDQDRAPGGVRSVPRGIDGPRAAAPEYRQNPGPPMPERRAPAVERPSERAPERPSARQPERQPDRPSGPPAGSARPRGGQSSSGTAVRRPGGR